MKQSRYRPYVEERLMVRRRRRKHLVRERAAEPQLTGANHNHPNQPEAPVLSG
jgi:hypothetical protein